jgi:hypothetical protein
VDESSGYIGLYRDKTSYFFQFNSDEFIEGGSYFVNDELFFGTIMRFDSNIVFVHVSNTFPVEISMFELNGISSDRIILRNDGVIVSVLQQEGFILISTSLNGETIKRKIKYTHYEPVDEEPELVDEESEDEESEDEEPEDSYKQAFNRLQKGQYEALKNQNLICCENDVCGISLTKFKNNSQVVALKCKHAFMITSLEKWIVKYKKFKCPTCRCVILS